MFKQKTSLTYLEAVELLKVDGPLPEDFPWNTLRKPPPVGSAQDLSPTGVTDPPVWTVAHDAAVYWAHKLPKDFSGWLLGKEANMSVFDLYLSYYRYTNVGGVVRTTFSPKEFKCKNLLDVPRFCVLT